MVIGLFIMKLLFLAASKAPDGPPEPAAVRRPLPPAGVGPPGRRGGRDDRPARPLGVDVGPARPARPLGVGVGPAQDPGGQEDHLVGRRVQERGPALIRRVNSVNSRFRSLGFYFSTARAFACLLFGTML